MKETRANVMQASEAHEVLSMSRVLSSTGPSDAWSIKGLGADSPYHELKEKLMLFGQFVGDWETEARYPKVDGTETRARGEIHFRWILEGRALQDTFMMIDERTGTAIPAGTTLRYYDQEIDAWHSIWFSPRQRVVQSFVARKEEDEIVLRGVTKEGYPERWIFSEISPDSFRWRAVESHDKEKTWLMTEGIRARRIESEKMGRKAVEKREA